MSSRFTESNAPGPTLSLILSDLKKRELGHSIFVCLQCSKETPSQQAMAAHCRQHVQAGMGKGTVEHLKYFPDHTYTFLCNKPQPNPQAPRSTDQQPMAEPPNPMNQVPTTKFLPYTGYFSIKDLENHPWLQSNGSHQDVNNTSNVSTTHQNLQQPRHNPSGGSSSLYPSGGLVMSPNANGVGTTPSVPPEIDLTLRLGPTPPRPTTEVSTPRTLVPFQVSPVVMPHHKKGDVAMVTETICGIHKPWNFRI